MKKLFLLVIVVLFAMSTQAFGYTITDNLGFGNEELSGSAYDGTLDKSYTHSFLDLTAYTITDATLSITVVDTPAVLQGAFSASLEGVSSFGSGTLGTGTETFSFNLPDLSVLGDNRLSVDLTAFNTFYLASSSLSITYEESEAPASMANPIPAPILLLGTGLIGLAGFRRRKSA